MCLSAFFSPFSIYRIWSICNSTQYGEIFEANNQPNDYWDGKSEFGTMFTNLPNT
jgi:hypothetical protein